MIKARAGDKMIVSGPGGNTVVILTVNTKTKDDKGLFGLDKEEMADTVLIPGLKVRIDGTRDSEEDLSTPIFTPGDRFRGGPKSTPSCLGPCPCQYTIVDSSQRFSHKRSA